MGIIIIFGAVILIALIWRWIHLEIKCKELRYELKDKTLKNQIFPHTIRNKIEYYRIQTKELKKLTDDFCNDINSVSNFLNENGEGIWK